MKTKKQMNPTFLIVDLFCGFGGTTTGFAKAVLNGNKVAKVIGAVNHDKKAIASHFLNHPDVLHFEEDVRSIDLRELSTHVAAEREKYPDALLVLSASLPCPHFSRARGAQPKDEEIRTMAKSLYMKWDADKKEHYIGDSYIQLLNPDYIMIENVEEFQSWGPLDENGKPISKKNGQDWMKWKMSICEMGYAEDWKHLNSADFGAYTSRNRFFQCFAKHGLPISWPQPTHSKKISDNGMFGGNIKKWKPVKDVLDFKNEGTSILTRKKPLSDKTLEVIYKGCIKAIKEGNDSILFKYYGNGDNLNSIDSPAGTLTTKDRFAKLAFIFRQYKTGFTTSINEPIGTLPTNPKANLISFIMNKSHGGHTTSINQPCPVIVASQHKAPLYIIKALMNEHGIVDIKYRMLTVNEMLRIQGFPSDYKMVGTQTDNKRMIGNSVVPDVSDAFITNLADKVNEYKMFKKAA